MASINSLPDDILQIILEKVDIYTIVVCLPLVCKKFKNIITNNKRRPFKLAMKKHLIHGNSMCYNYLPSYPYIHKTRNTYNYNVKVKDLNVVNIYAEHLHRNERNQPLYMILFGEGYICDDKQCSTQIQYFYYQGKITMRHDSPMLSKTGLYFRSSSIESLLATLKSYGNQHNPIKTFFKKCFKRTNAEHNLRLNITHITYHQRNLINTIYDDNPFKDSLLKK